MDSLRDAAFGDRPEADVWHALAGSPRDRWLAAVVLGAQGHYAAAATVLHDLLHARDPLFASLAASTLASHRRQLGGHAAARRLDARALALAPASGPADPDGIDAGGARADALLGLAADAVGAGRIAEARRLHSLVEATAWRTLVRRDWVDAEIHLAGGCPERAVVPAEAAGQRARQAGATRHFLKSELVLGTALVVWGTPESASRGVEVLLCDLNHTNRRGLDSLTWPTALVLSQAGAFRTVAESETAGELAITALSCVLRRADPISRRLAVESPWIPTALLRSGEPPNADARTNFWTD